MMINLSQLKHVALFISLAAQASCMDNDVDSDANRESRISSELATTVEIRSNWNNKCMDMGTNLSNGAPVALWDCWGGANQHWYWNGEEIRSSVNNKCMDMQNNLSNGAPVVMWDCWGGVNQHWYWDGTQIKSRVNNKCMDMQANLNNGAPVAMWDCWGGANQQWHS